MAQTTLTIHPADNVAVALATLQKGNVFAGTGGDIILQDTIPAKHKFAIAEIPAGATITMYGVIVGKAVTAIPPG